ncbi:hypothetical protein OROMI_020161 [Orobanche minor]
MVQKSKEAKKTDVCLNCGERGHWKRHCPKLDRNVPSGSGTK